MNSRHFRFPQCSTVRHERSYDGFGASPIDFALRENPWDECTCRSNTFLPGVRGHSSWRRRRTSDGGNRYRRHSNPTMYATLFELAKRVLAGALTNPQSSSHRRNFATFPEEFLRNPLRTTSLLLVSKAVNAKAVYLHARLGENVRRKVEKVVTHSSGVCHHRRRESAA